LVVKRPLGLTTTSRLLAGTFAFLVLFAALGFWYLHAYKRRYREKYATMYAGAEDRIQLTASTTHPIMMQPQTEPRVTEAKQFAGKGMNWEHRNYRCMYVLE